MSYTEYLRRKAAAAPKIIDTTVRTDASTITMRRRLQANAEFFTSTRQGVINNVNDPSNTGTSAVNKAPTVNIKASGGRIPDASMFTSFVGGAAINNDGGIFQTPQKYLMNSNSAGSISPCVAIPEPIPYNGTGTYTANMIPQNASNVIRTREFCTQPSTEPHIQNELGRSLYVGDDIALNRSIGSTTTYTIDTNGNYLGVNKVDNVPATAANCLTVNHTHPAVQPRSSYQPRPAHGQGGIPVFTVPSPDDARKVGGYDYKDRQKYIEKHHGNDLNVNPRRVPTKFQIPANSPAHLKINDPKK